MRVWIPIPNEALDLCEVEEWIAVVDLFRRGRGVRWRSFTVTERSLSTRWRVGNRRVWSIIERLEASELIKVVEKGNRRRPTSIQVFGPTETFPVQPQPIQQQPEQHTEQQKSTGSKEKTEKPGAAGEAQEDQVTEVAAAPSSLQPTQPAMPGKSPVEPVAEAFDDEETVIVRRPQPPPKPAVAELKPPKKISKPRRRKTKPSYRPPTAPDSPPAVGGGDRPPVPGAQAQVAAPQWPAEAPLSPAELLAQSADTPATIRRKVTQHVESHPPTSWGRPAIGVVVGLGLIAVCVALELIAAGQWPTPRNLLLLHLDSPTIWILYATPLYLYVLFQLRAANGMLEAQKRALKGLAASLFQNEVVIGGLMPCVLDGVLLVGPQGQIEKANPAAAALFGARQVEDLIGLSIDALLPQRHSMGGHNQQRRTASNGRVLGLEWPQQVARVDGSQVDVVVSGGQLSSGDQRAVYVVGEPRQAEKIDHVEDVRRLEDEVLQRDSLVSSMVYGLLSPLNTLEGYTNIVRTEMEGQKRTPMVAHLDRVLDAGRQIRGVVDKLIDFSKSRHGQVSVVMEPILVGALVREVADTVRPLAEQNGNEFIVSEAGQGDVVRADQIRVRQVLDHCLRNAFRYTQRGKVSFSATFDFRDGKPWVVFSVRDSGIGLQADELECIFDPEAGERSKLFAQSRETAHSMGGSLSIRSQAGKGTTAQLRLPAVSTGGKTIIPDLDNDELLPGISPRPVGAFDDEPTGETVVPDEEKPVLAPMRAAADDETPTFAEAPRLARPAKKPMVLPTEERRAPLPPVSVDNQQLILVIDDEEVHAAVERLRISDGSGVAWADAITGPEVARLIQPTAVVVAASRVGWGTITELQKSDITKSLPIVLVTSEEADVARGYQAGVAGFVQRPIDMDRLKEVLRRIHAD